jgi:eukaryotic-like serine/threonine-protein kinase
VSVIEAEDQRSFGTGSPVDGELLSGRLARGPVPAMEAVRIAIDLGLALKQIHAGGKVHGALAPQTILLPRAGGVRILEPPANPGREFDPYRSPEELRGDPVDSRADIFSYGAVLYEIATGSRAFPGTGDEVTRAILEEPLREPGDRTAAYSLMEPVIRACLQKHPIGRRQRVQNAVAELRFANRGARKAAPNAASRAQAAAAPGPVTVKVRTLRPGEPVPWTAPQHKLSPRATAWLLGIAAAFILLSVGGVLYLLGRRPAPASYAFRVEPPQNTTYPGTPAISPDGSYLTFSAVGPDGQRMLWLRPMDALHNNPIAGTEGASSPFWSPDGTHIGFFANRLLKKVALDGSAPETICLADDVAGGGSWSSDGTILFAPSLFGGIFRVSATAGATRHQVIKPDSARSETAFRWPRFLPDEKHFLFYALSDSPKAEGVYVGTLGEAGYRRLMGSDTNAVYSPPPPGSSEKTGYLLFMHDRNLLGQAFDLSKLAILGDPVALLDDIGSLGSMTLAPVSVAANGILVYQAVPPATRHMQWLDRGGRVLATVKDPGEWGDPRISPDGTRAMVGKLGADGQNADLWLIDKDGNPTRFTDTPIHEGSPVWGPDGTRVAFFESGSGAGNYDIYTARVGAGGHGSAEAPARPELLLRSDFQKYPTDWSRDGKYLLFTTLNPGTISDVWALSLSDRRAGPVLGTVALEGFGVFSPDGRWIAFQSSETGRNEVFVARFDGIDWSTRRHYPVSVGGGGHPRWRADGKEILYITGSGRVMAAPVEISGDSVSVGQPGALFQTNPLPRSWNLFDVSPDGQRFLVNLPLEVTKPASMAVVTNWMEKRRPASPAVE